MSDNKSVDRILRILEYISKNPKGLTLSQISRDLNIPKSTAFDFLQALYKADAVYYKDEISKKYVIGSKIYAIGQAYQKNSSLITVCKPIVKNLGIKYGNQIIVTKRVGNNIVYIHKYESDENKSAAFEIGGSISYIHSSSIGKCYLAFDKYFQNYKNLNLELVTPYTIIDGNALDGDINLAKTKGYTYDFKEDDENYKSVSFPIYNFESRCCGAITLRVPLEFDLNDEVINDLYTSSQNISLKLGYKKITKKTK